MRWSRYRSTSEVSSIIMLSKTSPQGGRTTPFDPVCSTCSILFSMFAEQDLEIPDPIAKMILCGILQTLSRSDHRRPQWRSWDSWVSRRRSRNFWYSGFLQECLMQNRSRWYACPTSPFQPDYKVFSAGDKKFGYGVMPTINPCAYAMKKGWTWPIWKTERRIGLVALFFLSSILSLKIIQHLSSLWNRGWCNTKMLLVLRQRFYRTAQ